MGGYEVLYSPLAPGPVLSGVNLVTGHRELAHQVLWVKLTPDLEDC